MSAPCRVWLANRCTPKLASSSADHVRSPDVASDARAIDDLREPSPREPASSLRARLTSALDRLARAHAGREVAVELGSRALAETLALALQLPPGAGSLAVASSAFPSAIDWPTLDGDFPSVAGIALDWRPPFSVARRPKYPGGPGSAPASRG